MYVVPVCVKGESNHYVERCVVTIIATIVKLFINVAMLPFTGTAKALCFLSCCSVSAINRADKESAIVVSSANKFSKPAIYTVE